MPVNIYHDDEIILVCRMPPPPNFHALISGTCEYVTCHGKKETLQVWLRLQIMKLEIILDYLGEPSLILWALKSWDLSVPEAREMWQKGNLERFRAWKGLDLLLLQKDGAHRKQSKVWCKQLPVEQGPVRTSWQPTKKWDPLSYNLGELGRGLIFRASREKHSCPSILIPTW